MSDLVQVEWQEECYQRWLGMRIVDWTPQRMVMELDVEPHHLNRSGTVHGGVLCSLLDTALSLAGLHSDSPERMRKAVTLSLTTTFVAPARTGTLRTIGRLRGGGRSTFMASGEVLDGDGNLVALGEGTFRRRRGSETPEGANG